MSPKSSADTSAPTAVTYLRVSTTDQAKRGGEEEGYSLPVQRHACYAKAEAIGAAVVEEFMDAGESAKTADRHEFQKMLAYVEEHHVKFVIVHKVDRFARNHEEDVLLNKQLREHGARLVSAMENIDDTPAGKLMHTMLSGMSQYYIDNLALEVMKGLKQKVTRGGTPFKAPLGYVNDRQIIDGREARIITVDAERADHVRWLFNAYATGEWSLERLAKEVSLRGLTTRPTPKRPAGPVGYKLVGMILSNRYYIGYVTYQGIEYQGNHQPLTTPETFATCQDVMAARRVTTERPQKHRHYLTGTVKCARCGGGLVYNVIGGTKAKRYDYFTCIRRLNREGCDLPYLPTEEVEQLIDRIWNAEQITDKRAKRIHADLAHDMAAVEQEHHTEVRSLDQRISTVKAQRIKWAENATDGVVPSDIARDKQAELAAQLVLLESRRADIDHTITERQTSLKHVMTLLRRCGVAYQHANPLLRRQMNQTWFTHITIDDRDGRAIVHEVARTEPFASLHQLISEPDIHGVTSGDHSDARTDDIHGVARTGDTPHDPSVSNEKRPGLIRGVTELVGISNFRGLVGPEGLEPPTSTV